MAPGQSAEDRKALIARYNPRERGTVAGAARKVPRSGVRVRLYQRTVFRGTSPRFGLPTAEGRETTLAVS